jgi:hypothetical protein
MWIVGGLWDEDAVRPIVALHKVVASDISHDLRSGDDFDVEFILDLIQLLCGVSGICMSVGCMGKRTDLSASCSPHGDGSKGARK